jgi:hypothetical protein
MAAMRGLGILTPLLSVLLASSLAHATSREAKERAARKACLSGDYAKGVEILSDLFLDTNDATYIFNQARCFEQNNRCEEAIGPFLEYLRKARGLTTEDKADTERHIAGCQALLGLKTSPTSAGDGEIAGTPKGEAPAPAASSVTPSPPSLAAPPPPDAPEQVAAANTAQPAATHLGSGLRIAGIACGAIGVVSVGTAIYYYTRAKSYSDKVSGQTVRNSSDLSAGRHAETMQWVFYSAGAAAIATGTLLYVLGWQATDAGRAVAGVAPLLGPGVAGISAQGVF